MPSTQPLPAGLVLKHTLAMLVCAACLLACTAATQAPATSEPPAPSPPPPTEALPTVDPTPTLTPSPSPIPPTPTPEALQFDGEAAMAHAEAQCAIGPRPAGSEALLETRDYIMETVRAAGWEVIEQNGEFQGVSIYNVIAVKGEGELARMVGAHYDTRPVADRDATAPGEPIVGGNDGASGVAILLELARTLEVPEGRQVQLAFFDAEDRGNLEGWPFSVGARQVAQQLGGLPIVRPEAMVLLDMVGDADLQIYRERNSDVALSDVLFEIAGELGYDGNGFHNEEKWAIIDDHLPFLEQGIPAVDLIDFDYSYWHTVEDTCDKLSTDSLFKVGRVVEVWLEER